jgi:hypothetical protein
MLQEYAEREKTKEEEIARLRAEVERIEREKRMQEFSSFCEELIREGKLTPAMRPIVMDFLEILHSIQEYEFSEGDGKVKAKPVERFKAFLNRLPKQIVFGEKATTDRAGDSKKTVDFEAEGRVDEERMELHRKAIEYMEKNKGISYIDALKKVIKEA